jgi:hypothetical protein
MAKRRGQGSAWTPLYMLIVIVIAAVLVITLIKPAFKLASSQAAAAEREAGAVARAALFLLPIAWKRR